MDTMAAGNLYVGALDYKQYHPERPFKRFYRIAKYAKQKSLIWRSVADALNGPAGGFNVLPNCITSVNIPVTNLVPGV